MPKWVPYAIAAVAVWYFFLRGKITGGANLGLATGNNATGFTGYGGALPPGVTQQQAAGAYGAGAITVGNPSGTSVAQDVNSYVQAAAGAAGIFSNLWNTLGGSSSSGDSSGGSYGDPTYGNDAVNW